MRQNDSHYNDMWMNIQTVTAQCAWKGATAQSAWVPSLLLCHFPAQWTLRSSKSINLLTNQLGIQV